MDNPMLTALALCAGALALYATLVWLANAYSQRTGWEPPVGSEGTDWVLRARVALALGAVTVAAGALACSLWVAGWPARLLITAQAAVFAAAGASDLRRFHLPLPLTAAGFGLAIATAAVTQLPAVLIAFGLAWAVVVIALHVLLSKGSMQLGDHLATLWIALAAPLNGLLAVAMGDFANVVLARARRLRGRKVAAAGGWLICAAVCVGLPPYVAWFTGRPQAGGPPLVAARNQESDAESPSSPSSWSPAYAGPSGETTTAADPLTGMLPQTRTVTTTLLLQFAERAGDYTASVAFEDERAGRVLAARDAAGHVAQLAALAKPLDWDSGVAAGLADLATALDDYDVEGVRSASLQLAEACERLTPPPLAGTATAR